jgi:hypothetical protein
MPFNPQSWSKIVESGQEGDIDPADEAASGTNLIPSLKTLVVRERYWQPISKTPWMNLSFSARAESEGYPNNFRTATFLKAICIGSACSPKLLFFDA